MLNSGEYSPSALGPEMRFYSLSPEERNKILLELAEKIDQQLREGNYPETLIVKYMGLYISNNQLRMVGPLIISTEVSDELATMYRRLSALRNMRHSHTHSA